MTRTLVVLRHAKSDWPEGVADLRRPLNDRGRRDAPAAGAWLREHVGPIDLALVSPATRTQQTWELASAELAAAPPARLEERLYGCGVEDIIDLVRALPASARTVAVVGHNPDIQDLVTVLACTHLTVKTSTIAVLTTLSDWPSADAGWATLRTSETPRGI